MPKKENRGTVGMEIFAFFLGFFIVFFLFNLMDQFLGLAKVIAYGNYYPFLDNTEASIIVLVLLLGFYVLWPGFRKAPGLSKQWALILTGGVLAFLLTFLFMLSFSA